MFGTMPKLNQVIFGSKDKSLKEQTCGPPGNIMPTPLSDTGIKM